MIKSSFCFPEGRKTRQRVQPDMSSHGMVASSSASLEKDFLVPSFPTVSLVLDSLSFSPHFPLFNSTKQYLKILHSTLSSLVKLAILPRILGSIRQAAAQSLY